MVYFCRDLSEEGGELLWGDDVQVGEVFKFLFDPIVISY